MTQDQVDFYSLVESIRQAHSIFSAQASKAVNVNLTLRNWVIGCHIAVYELQGTDRASYGERLFDALAEQLASKGFNRIDVRELRRYRQFYCTYPQIRETVSPILLTISIDEVISLPAIRETLSPEFVETLPSMNPSQLLERLSFSHFVELLQIEQPLKRRFYEIETVRGNWSVRELRRQVATQYFERSGLSIDKETLAQLVAQKAQTQSHQQVIRDPYVFEFLGLKPQEVMTERKLEDALLDKLQAFLLELGHGFCFEARQKRITIGGEHCFVDLVFYHRILKCHILIELKNDAFKHENLGQLNTYVSYFTQHEMSEGDAPPIGILLCTQKNNDMVQFALAGMSNSLFVSRYQLQLPQQEEMEAFLRRTLEELNANE